MPLLSRRSVGDNKYVGLRASVGIDRIGLGIHCPIPFAVPFGAAGASIPTHRSIMGQSARTQSLYGDLTRADFPESGKNGEFRADRHKVSATG